nr:MAG TPA: hypothetical protein [Herelleviridae sp.]
MTCLSRGDARLSFLCIINFNFYPEIRFSQNYIYSIIIIYKSNN